MSERQYVQACLACTLSHRYRQPFEGEPAWDLRVVGQIPAPPRVWYFGLEFRDAEGSLGQTVGVNAG